MDKNLVLVQNGFPGSNTSGTIIDTLNLKNFFKFEKDVVPTKYVKRLVGELYSGLTEDPYTTSHDFLKTTYTEDDIKRYVRVAQYYLNNTGELKQNTDFKHYSITPILCAVRMKQGFLGTNVLITSRLQNDNIKIRFLDIGNSLDDFKNMSKMITPTVHGDYYRMLRGHRCCTNSISIPSLDQYNHCFLAVVFSDTAYTLESGTVLLNNEPLLNISWTETEFIEAQ